MIGVATLFVPDYDIAISYYTQTLEFVLSADEKIAQDKRWAIVKPYKHAEFGLLFGKANGPSQYQSIGQQIGGRVCLFLYVDDFESTHKTFKEHGVMFLEDPRNETYGMVAKFQDIFGNI